MKKLLMTMMATAICALVITSCVKGPDDIPPSPTPTPTPTPTPEEQYDAAFLSYVGGSISPSQDWGFNAGIVATRGMTRGADRRDGYALSDGIPTDKYPKMYSKEFYETVFNRLPEPPSKMAESIHKNFEFRSNGPFRFDLIFTNTTKNDIEIGYYHYGPNETPYSRKEKPLISSLADDLKSDEYFQYSPDASTWKTPTPDKGYDMFAKGNWVQARMFTLRDGSEKEDPTIDVPVNDRVGFYVKIDGKKYYTNCYLNNDEADTFFAVLDEKEGTLSGSYTVGIDDLNPADDDCNDLIINVHKKIEDTYPTLIFPERPVLRVIGEDLSATENTDFDFNDIVLDVSLTKDGAECVLQAAGGQLPLRINYDDNYEVHKLFGVEQKIMVNTNADKKGLPSAKKDPVKFSIKGSFKSIDEVMIQVYKDDGKWHPLYADTGKPACKILVDTTFKWPDELESIKAVYPKFTDYVKEPTVKWYP